MARRARRGSNASLKQLQAATHRGRPALGGRMKGGATVRPGYFRAGGGLNKALTTSALTNMTPTPSGPEPHWPYGA